MAKYRVDTDQGSYMVETDEPSKQPPAESSAPAKAASAFGETSGVKALMNIMGARRGTPEDVQRAKDTLRGLWEGLANEPTRVMEEFRQANFADTPGSAAYHAVGAIPLVGAGVQTVLNDISNRAPAEAVGHTAGLLLPLAPKALKASGRVAAATLERLPAEIPVAPRIVRPTNPKIMGALDYLESKGAKIPLAARTDNEFIRNVQKGLDATPGGALTAAKDAKTNTAVLQSEAQNLIERATPETPAKAHYAEFQAAEADPANLQTVTVGKRLSPQANAALDDASIQRFGQGYSSLDQAQAKIIRQGVQDAGVDLTPQPVTEQVAMPVTVTGLKAEIKPIFDTLTRTWEPAKRNASAGYTAMKSILEGPEIVPASIAEDGLSGLKTLAREGEGRSAGIGKLIVPKLQKLIDDAAGAAGPDVMQALQSGRKAAAAEVAVDKLTDIFTKAQNEGGFTRTAGLWQDWLRARKDIARQLPLPLVSDFEKFFLGAKRLAENPNPSGSFTGYVSGAMLTNAFYNPATGVPAILGAGALAKILRTRAGVQALTRGLRVPVGTPAGQALAKQIMQLAEAEPAGGAGAALALRPQPETRPSGPSAAPAELTIPVSRINEIGAEAAFQEQKARVTRRKRNANQ